jgi:hypothetical protein
MDLAGALGYALKSLRLWIYAGQVAVLMSELSVISVMSELSLSAGGPEQFKSKKTIKSKKTTKAEITFQA